MPIVIQDLLASDTLSQAVDKINFNFDQLILNGGGPAGPLGPAGPTGPAGGRGIKGATWYKDSTVSPGTDPNNLIIVGINDDDYFLQSNGQVWQYNGTVWVQSVINLLGPQGLPGSASGFNYAGGFPGGAGINNQNAAYLTPMPAGLGGGANQITNEGISTVLFGAVASNAIPPAGITFTSAFKLPDIITESLDSSVLTMLVHQKDSASSAIRFMGGGVSPADKYEQAVLTNLSNITLGVDDSFDINVPKASTAPSSLSDLIGFNLNTLKRGQQFYSGKQITFIAGADTMPSGLSGEISDVRFTINTTNPSIPAKFAVSTIFASASSLFEIGGNITIPLSTSYTGSALVEAGQISLVGGTNVSLRRSSSQYITLSSAGVLINDQSTIINEITGPSDSVLVQYGSLASIPIISTKTGSALIDAFNIGLVSNNIQLNREVNQRILLNMSSLANLHTLSIRHEVIGFPSARILLGSAAGIVPPPTQSDRNGNILVDANVVRVIGNATISISRSPTQLIDITPTGGIRIIGNTPQGVKIQGKTFLTTVPVTGAVSTSQILARNTITDEVEVLPASAILPTGAIMMWSSTTVMPSGWYLCNGQTVVHPQIGPITTPDLREKFIVGAGVQANKFVTDYGGSFTLYLEFATVPGTYTFNTDTQNAYYVDSTGRLRLDVNTDGFRYHLYRGTGSTSSASFVYMVYDNRWGAYEVIQGALPAVNALTTGNIRFMGYRKGGFTYYTANPAFPLNNDTFADYTKYFALGRRVAFTEIIWPTSPSIGYMVGDVGGADTVILQGSQIPKHQHDSASGENFAANATYGLVGLQNNPGAKDSDNYHYLTSAYGNNQPHENRPPYYALAFIMYIGV